MEWKKGNRRIVLLVGPFAIKIARVRLIKYLATIRQNWTRAENLKNFLRLVKKDLCYPIDTDGGFKHLIFRGLLANLREFAYFVLKRCPNMMPIYFSLLGFVNIQRSGLPCDLDYRTLWFDHIQGKLQDDGIESPVRRFGHHFSNSENFCFDSKGRLRMVDYGDPETVWLLQKYPDLLEPFHKPSD